MARVLVIGMNYSPELIGCSRYTSDLVQYIAEARSRCEVVTTPPHYPGWQVQSPYRAWFYASETVGGVRVTRCPLLMKANGSGLWRLIAPLTFGASALPVVLWRALRLRPDVILCVVPTLFAAPAAVLASGLIGARLVFHVQDLEVDAAFAVGHLRHASLRRVALAFERRMLRAAAAVVSISRRMCERLAAKGVAGEAIFMIRNWVDTASIHPGGDGTGFRSLHGLSADAFVAMYAGHIGAKQGLEILLEAARRSLASPRLKVLIVGDGPMKAPLMAAYAGLQNVVWLPVQPERELCAMLNAVDVHVLPQLRSAADLVLPSKLGGMLASGKRMIIAADPGTELAEFVAGAAVLIPPGDPDAMAAAILAAMGEREGQGASAARLRLAAELERSVLLQRFHGLLTSYADQPIPAAVVAAAAK